MDNQTNQQTTTVQPATAEERVTEISNSFDNLLTEIEEPGRVSDETYQRAVFALKTGKLLLNQIKR